MTKCIDISENRRLSSVSPIAIMAWVIVFTVLTAVMKPGIFYILINIFSYIVTNILFQYTPRYVKWFIVFLFTNRYLTPSFEDKKYLGDHRTNKHLQRILPLENSSSMGDGLGF